MLRLVFYTLLFPQRGHKQCQCSPVAHLIVRRVDLKFETRRKRSSTRLYLHMRDVGCQAAI